MKKLLKMTMLACLLSCYYVHAQSNLDFLANLKEVVGKYDVQSPKKAIGVIIYKQIYHPDTTRLDSLQIDTMALSYSNHFSEYRNNGLRLLDSTFSIIIDRKSKEDPTAKNMEPFPAYNYKLSKIRFLSANQNVYEYKKLIDKSYLLKYITKKIKWDIVDSTKNICGFNCQKATALILGRFYMAWFTTDIPSSFGPRTIVGLPGMILQAYDSTRQIEYMAMQVFGKNDANVTIGLPSRGILSTKKNMI